MARTAPIDQIAVQASSDKVKKSFQTLMQETYTGVFTPELEAAHFQSAIAFEPKHEILSRIQQSVSSPISEPFLEIGSGYGTFSMLCHSQNIKSYGIEPDRACLNLSRLRQKEAQISRNTFTHGIGEALPFKDSSFGLVLLDNVIEHVQDIDAVIQEAFRVLKPNGYFYLLAPNYAAFRKEAHYGLPWLPLLPRYIARPYIRRYRGNTAFFETLNYTTSRATIKKVKSYTKRFIWPTLVKLSRPDLCKNKTKRSILTWANRLYIAHLIKVIEYLRLQNPFIRRIEILAQKTDG